jgi:tripartite-type tricarboxylate transporter receptor subunit TctC
LVDRTTASSTGDTIKTLNLGLTSNATVAVGELQAMTTIDGSTSTGGLNITGNLDKVLNITTGSGADTAVYPEFFAQFLGLKIRTVKGYPGSNEVILAMERGEVDGICVAYDALARQRLFLDGKINILFQASLKKDPKIKGDPPLVLEANPDPQKKDILEFFLSRAAFGRPLVAPPNVPKDRLAALQKAFLDTMSDPVFAAEAEKLGLTIDPISGTELAALVEQAYRTPEASVRALSEMLKNLGK